MTDVSLSDPANDTLADANLIVNNNASLRTVINGGLTNGNVSASALIALTKLDLSNGFRFNPASPTGIGHASLVQGESQNRFQIDYAGVIGWGSGSATPDTNLYRSAANTLATDDTFSAALSAFVGVGGAAGSQGVFVLASGDTQARITLLNDGVVKWGPGGSTSPDTNLYRSGTNALKTDDDFFVAGEIKCDMFVRCFSGGANQVLLGWNGAANAPAISFGSSLDTNLYRDSANVLATDDQVWIKNANGLKFNDGTTQTTAAAAGTQLDYAQVTSNQTCTATTEGTSTSLITGNSVSYDGTKNRIEFFAPGLTQSGGASPLTLVLYRDTTVLGQVVLDTSTALNRDVNVVFYDTPSAASHTYKVFGFQTAGTNAGITAGAGGSGNKVPAFLRVTKA